MGSISCDIMPLVINSLGGVHTHAHTDIHKETILRNQCAPGLTFKKLNMILSHS